MLLARATRSTLAAVRLRARAIALADALASALAGALAAGALHAQPARDSAASGPPGHRWSASSEAGPIVAEVVAAGIAVPSSLAFLPDGRLLAADRARGVIWMVDPRTGAKDSVRNVPAVHGRVDGGMLDLLPHPDFARNRLLYLAYAADGPGGSTTVVDRARLDGGALAARERLFTALPWVATSSNHFGARLVLQGGYLFVAIGDRDERVRAQDLMQHHGKIVRLHEDGRVPADNPLVARSDARPEIWSWGHRNPNGMAVHPVTRELWVHEHGPRGGDEINVVRAGRNYGWPLVTFGREYDGRLVGDGATQRDGLEPPLHYWVPSIAPSGMAFYGGRAFPSWRGSLLVGAMAGRHLDRIVVRNGRVVLEERLLRDMSWRVRSLAEGPDGAVYLGVDGGMVLRVRPPDPPSGR